MLGVGVEGVVHEEFPSASIGKTGKPVPVNAVGGREVRPPGKGLLSERSQEQKEGRKKTGS